MYGGQIYQKPIGPARLTQHPSRFHDAQVWLFLNVDNERNLLDGINRVLPRFPAVAAMTHILGAGRFVGRIDMPPEIPWYASHPSGSGR